MDVSKIKLEKLASPPFYTEGPATDSKGNMYCTTLSGGSILKIDAEHKISQWAYSDCPNGQIILNNDDHLVCDITLAAIRRFDSEGRFIRNEIEKYCNGIEVHCPNDLITDLSGNIYFTDSIRNKGKVFFLGIQGEQNILADDMDYPNGLVLSPDQKTLYVAESYKNRIIKIDLLGLDHGKNRKEVFAELPSHSSGKITDNLPDGLAMDSDGNIWVAHYGMQAIHKLSPEGKLLLSVNTDMPLTSNLFFCNPDTIMVTGGYGEPGPGGLFKVLLPTGESISKDK